MLRAEREDPNSEHGQLITNCIKEGTIVPVEITVGLLWKAIRHSGRRYVLVDGFPRNYNNLIGWQKKLAGRVELVGVLDFSCPDEVLIQRLTERGKSSGRDDDDLAIIQKRLATFHKETEAVIRYYDEIQLLLKVDANRAQDVVFDDVCALLKQRLNLQALPPHDDYVLAMPRNRIHPRCVLGTMTIGGETGMKDKAYQDFLKEFCKHNDNIEIDTARVYSNGETEALLGKFFKQHGSEAVSIATKVHPKHGFSSSAVAAQVQESLKVLQVKSVDIIYMHAPDRQTPVEETLQALNELHHLGKFKELGLSNYAAWEVAHIYHVCANRGFVKPTIYQGMYNVLTREVETELIPCLRSFGIRFYAYNPLAGGLLTPRIANLKTRLPQEGRFSEETSFGDMYRQRYLHDSYLTAVVNLSLVCQRFKLSLADASLRWLAHHSAVRTGKSDGIVIGASSLNQLKENTQSVLVGGPLPLPVAVAFDQAWFSCKGDSPSYFRG